MSKKIHSTEDVARLRAILGPRLRAARNALGLTQEQAAGKIHISTEFFARMERGNALPSVETLAKIADALNVTVAHLIGMDVKSARDSPLVPLSAQLSSPKESRSVRYILKRVDGNPDLRRLIMALLKYCGQLPEPEPDESSPG